MVHGHDAGVVFRDSYTRPDPADQFTGANQLRYLQAKAMDCRRPADAYKLTGGPMGATCGACHPANATMPSPGAHGSSIGSSAPSQAAPSHLSEVIGDFCAYIAAGRHHPRP